MKNWTKCLAGVGAAALMAVSTASPAQAQYYDRDRYDRDRGIDVGDVAAGVAIVGGLALAIDALTDNDRSRYYGYDRRYVSSYGYGYDYGYGGQRAALNACASVARRYGQVERISDVDLRRNGTYRVRGRVLVRDYDGRGWNRRAGWDRESFTCYAQGSRVYDFRV
ncbi:hypothetical protein [Sphingosinicella sp. CPCC 101087]|uniref:hypothetical protein n=1 Tax=Sphingosinicella sp. CPCC 101087 TaxID=2497754 RepID=UPI00101D877D|nr:hypothetical protein [Sphingosinicella sp. CPCC 101087]